ncbi:MAG TPA: branched-chain amino acid transaminase [Gemmatimonadaceae bacterium]|nr:branched-chain amino acid transaminase [Gemmatimonadaceae bacterium]
MAKIPATEFIWKNGDFIKWDDAQVHLLAHSVQFGSAVFEGIRCYSTPKGPAIFRLREHLKRMFNSCRIYRMPVDYSMEQLVDAARGVVRRNRMESCYVRPMVLRGYGAAGMVPFESPVEVYIPCWKWGAYLGEDALAKGVDACVATWHRVAPNTIPAMAKIAGNYLNGQLIKMEALSNGYDEAIALSTDGMISEGSGQNLFAVSEGVLYTPPIDGTILPGITRDTVITLAAELGIRVAVQPLSREVLYTSDELFVCGTASEVTPLKSVDRIQVGAGKPGEITRAIQKRFLDIVNGTAEDTHGWMTFVN